MRVETMRFKTTHTSTFGSTTTGVGTASITATTLGECTDTAADVVAEDAFVARVGHDCFKLCWEGRWGCRFDGEDESLDGNKGYQDCKL